MTTKTETAILAAVAALITASLVPGSKITAPTRNMDIASRLVDVGSGTGLALHLNVLDGDAVFGDDDELLGADLGNTEAYDREQQISVEWAVAGGTDAAREARFDEGRKEIWDALKAVVVGGVATYLGGAVDGMRLVTLINHHNTSVAGLPNIKSCIFVYGLTFTSSDPF